MKKIHTIFIFFLMMIIIGPFPAYAVLLLTPEEARQEDAPGESIRSTIQPPTLEGKVPAPEGEQRFLVIPKTAPAGPDIKILSPELEKAILSPLKLMVLFIPREGTQVDISTLRVECLKFITINITDRLKEYISSQGINVERAELPSGTHKIRITVADTKGGTTRMVFVFRVQ
ncbi:MAG: hypothetical protein NTX36_12630 [Proteobacteria bacterium]|nr:hypothetical protein [Pseudomonadota bacterium]